MLTGSAHGFNDEPDSKLILYPSLTLPNKHSLVLDGSLKSLGACCFVTCARLLAVERALIMRLHSACCSRKKVLVFYATRAPRVISTHTMTLLQRFLFEVDHNRMKYKLVTIV